MKHKATLISVMTEKVFEKNILDVLEEEGAKGFTVFEGGGNGSFHLHQSQHLSMVDEFRIVKVEVIVLDPKVADRIAERLVDDCFDQQPGIVHLSEVQVFRKTKF